MKALVSTQETKIYYVTSWTEIPNTTPTSYSSNIDLLSNAQRICQVEEDSNVFEVNPNGFKWVDCSNDCKADLWYFDTSDNTCKVVPHATYPGEISQPIPE